MYIFCDYPNDQDPNVYEGKDLFDGKPGNNLGIAFDNPSHGSDAGFINGFSKQIARTPAL